MEGGIKNHPGMVLYGHPPRWHKFDSSVHTDSSLTHYHAKKSTEVQAAQRLSRDDPPAGGTPAEHVARMQGMARGLQERASFGASLTLIKQAMMSEKVPSASLMQSLNTLVHSAPDRARALLRGVRETLGDDKFDALWRRVGEKHGADVLHAGWNPPTRAPANAEDQGSRAPASAGGDAPAASEPDDGASRGSPETPRHEHLDQIPWDRFVLADSNVNAKTVNKRRGEIKAAAYAGDLMALSLMTFGSNSYGKQSAKLAETAMAAVREGNRPVLDGWKAAIAAGKAPSKQQVKAVDLLPPADRDALVAEAAGSDDAEAMSAVMRLHRPPSQSGPKEGDTKVENGVTYRLEGGRWHRVDTAGADLASASHEEIEAAGGKGADSLVGAPRFYFNDLPGLDGIGKDRLFWAGGKLHGEGLSAEQMATAQQAINRRLQESLVPTARRPVDDPSPTAGQSSAPAPNPGGPHHLEGGGRFWTAEVNGSVLVTHQGRAGSKGAVTARHFASPAAAQAGLAKREEAMRSKGMSPAAESSPAPDASWAAPVLGTGPSDDEDRTVDIAGQDVSFSWRVVDASDLAPSTGNSDNQFRDRSRAASADQVQSIAGNLKFRMLADSPVMDYGAPVLASDGKTIIGGNGRTLAIQAAYDQGAGGGYKRDLLRRAAQFGLSAEQVSAMQSPVLIRVLDQEVDVRQAAIASNEGGGARMSSLEQAAVDGERLGTLDGLVVDEAGDFNNRGNLPFIRRFLGTMPANQRNSFVTGDGLLSQEGIQRLRNAILFRAYGKTEVLERMVESADTGQRNILTALTRMAPVVAKAKSAVQGGSLHDLDISADIVSATATLMKIRSEGIFGSVSEYLDQGSLFGDDDGVSPAARIILRHFDAHLRSSRAIADFLWDYYDAVERLGDPRQGSLMGDLDVPSREQLLEGVNGNESEAESNDDQGRLF